MLDAVVASVDQRHAKVDEFIELAIEGTSDAGVETKKILKHLGAVGQGFLRVAGLAAKRFLVDLFHFVTGGFGADQTDASHCILQVGVNRFQPSSSSSQMGWFCAEEREPSLKKIARMDDRPIRSCCDAKAVVGCAAGLRRNISGACAGGYGCRREVEDCSDGECMGPGLSVEGPKGAFPDSGRCMGWRRLGRQIAYQAGGAKGGRNIGRTADFDGFDGGAAAWRYGDHHRNFPDNRGESWKTLCATGALCGHMALQEWAMVHHFIHRNSDPRLRPRRGFS